MYIDVNISDSKAERISVFDGDTPERLALNFVDQHGLSKHMHNKLEHLLKKQMADIDKIKEEKMS